MNNQNFIGQKAMEKSIEVLKILLDTGIKPNQCQNERYLHHYFSKEMQNQKDLEIDFGNLQNSKLHPEWPTYKKSTGISFSKYRKNGEKKYIVDTDDGSSGFIDFTIGDYSKPAFAIEFTSKYGFGREDLTYDFLKLLDAKNPFEYVVSFNLIFRENGLPKGGHEENIIKALTEVLADITDKEKGRNLEIAENRQYLFWIIEIDNNGKNRHWVCEDVNSGFEKKEPNFSKYKKI